MRIHRAVFAGLLLLSACSSAPRTADGASDGGLTADGGVVDPWAEVDRLTHTAVEAEDLPGLGLAVYDSTGQLVFQRMYRDFAPDRRVAVASASKLVAGLVLFRLIGEGKLSLDSTTGDVLGWTGPQAAITLRHLLSFTSGLKPSAPCTLNQNVALADCVTTISARALDAAPGARFDYGSTHLAVAGRMAEVVTGKQWNVLFDELIKQPLGLPAEVTYFTAPRQSQGTTNPLIAGGMRASMDEYAKLLRLSFFKGTANGTSIIDPAIFDEQTREPFPNVVVGNSPVVDVGQTFRYGLTAWLECDTPATGCTKFSSPGAFGWTPWIDRDAGYYAIIGTEVGQTDNGTVKFAIDLEQALQPAIRQALVATAR